MKHAKSIVISLVLIAVSCGTFALAQTAAPKPVDWRKVAEAKTSGALASLIRYYKPTDDQKVKLKAALIAQYKDLMDYDRVRGPKLKALDAEVAAVKVKIAALQKQIAEIETRRTVHSKARAELLLDHKAEIANVFTQEQRVARIAGYLRYYVVSSTYWSLLPKATQDSLTAQFNAAAEDIIDGGKPDDSESLRVAGRKIRADNPKMLTPEIRQAGDAKYLYSIAMRKFVRIELTESQKANVQDMCEKAAKQKAELQAKYEQASRDRDALRRTVSSMSSSIYYRKIREDVIQSVLTDAQLKKAGLKRKTPKPVKTP